MITKTKVHLFGMDFAFVGINNEGEEVFQMDDDKSYSKKLIYHINGEYYFIDNEGEKQYL
jgi:hypothetical protein